jgi:hypothetical protein
VATLAMLSPLSREASVGMLFTKATHSDKSLEYARPAEDDHVVRARIAHGVQERGHVGDVVGVARRRVAGEAGFDVTYLRRRSEMFSGPAPPAVQRASRVERARARQRTRG